jgi:hypothetical protein
MNNKNLDTILQGLLDHIVELQTKVSTLEINTKCLEEVVDTLRNRLDEEGHLSYFEPLD